MAPTNGVESTKVTEYYPREDTLQNPEVFVQFPELQSENVIQETVVSKFSEFVIAFATTPPGPPSGGYLSPSNGSRLTADYNYFHFDSSEFRHNVLATVIFCVAYFAVLVFGVVGNLLTILVVYRCPRMRNVTNFFIVNLAVADLVILILTLPGTLISNIFVDWLLGETMCKIVPFVQGLVVHASVYSLVAVSIDRCLAICYPLKFQMTTRTSRIVIAVIWVYSIIVTGPWLLSFRLRPFDVDRYFCMEAWEYTALDGNMHFFLVNVLSGYIIPLVVISQCYIQIYIRVWKRDIPGDSKNAQMERIQHNSKIKVIKMLLLVVVIFMASWLPLLAIFARIKFGSDLTEWESSALPYAAPIAQFMGVSSSSVNPLLYALFNNKFRHGFSSILESRQCCTKVRYYDTVALANSSSASLRKSSYYTVRNKSLNRQISQDKQLACIEEGPTGV